MSILARFTPRSLTAEQYDRATKQLEEAESDWPPDGLDIHVCFGSDGELKVSEIWDSQDQFDAFGERLMPQLADLGIDPGDPEIIEVHNIIRR
jgi:hypothetical protein